MVSFQRAVLLSLAFGVSLLTGNPTPLAQKQLMLRNLEKHFSERNLGALRNSSNRKIILVIEHSLIPPPEGIEKVRVKNFEAAEKWLRSKERFHDAEHNEHMPFRAAKEGAFSDPNLFEYDIMGINHNTWYLSKVYFSSINGSIFISKVVIYDGD
jgi:hypothetical protein